ncbi:MAG: MFS transporter [Nitrososphaerota archaeon]|nr:MFS transporter [Nitrososphaerota archaeon]
MLVWSNILVLFGMGTLFSFGMFIPHMEMELGWSRSIASAAFLINWIIIGLLSVLMGRASDTTDPRSIILMGGVAGGLGIFFMGLVKEPWQLYVTYGFLGGLLGSISYAPLTAIIARRFRDDRALSGLAIASIFASVGLGTFIVSQVFPVVVQVQGWRTLVMIFGAVTLVCALLAGFFIGGRENPSEGISFTPPRENGSLGHSGDYFHVSRIAIANLLCCTSHSGPYYHLPLIASWVGHSELHSSMIFGSAGVLIVLVRLVVGYLSGRVWSPALLTAMLYYQGALILIYFITPAVPSILDILGPLLGIAFGAVIPLFALAVRDVYGERRMGLLYGIVFMCSSVGMGIGPLLAGFLYDLFRSYLLLFPLTGVMSLIAALLVQPIGFRKLKSKHPGRRIL